MPQVQLNTSLSACLSNLFSPSTTDNQLANATHFTINPSSPVFCTRGACHHQFRLSRDYFWQRSLGTLYSASKSNYRKQPTQWVIHLPSVPNAAKQLQITGWRTRSNTPSARQQCSANASVRKPTGRNTRRFVPSKPMPTPPPDSRRTPPTAQTTQPLVSRL